MISTSDAYKEAIVADARRMRLKVTAEIADPDMTAGGVTASAGTDYSKPAQLADGKNELLPPLITLERNRWLLNGGYIPVGQQAGSAETGYVSAAVSGADGTLASPVAMTFAFTGVNILQGATVFFSQRPEDGVPRALTLEILKDGAAAYSETVTGNTARKIEFKGFTVNYPTGMRVTVTEWSMPYRRVRAAELFPGIYEEWTGDELEEFSVKLEGNFTGLALPYGTCSLRMDNLDRRFEPRNKDGIFLSIEERQGIRAELGVDTPSGTEYVPLGVFYQYDKGWTTSDNDIAMKWNLVDIVGMLNNRLFAPSGTLPTTLGGWAAALVGQLGENFAKRYSVDPDYADTALTVNSIHDLDGATCGKILLWICQASQTWPRADAETGYLCIEPFWNEGNILGLDNLESYPTMSANEDIALITFTLNNDDKTQIAWNGNSISAPRTASVNNPFLHTVEQARKAAQMMITAYGGNRLETTGRGDPSGEIGDVATVELDESSATTGRVMSQTFQFRNGVLQGCKTVLLQASGGKLYDETVLIVDSGTWTVPEGVNYIRLTLGQGGQGGGHGEAGFVGTTTTIITGAVTSKNGEDGLDGSGGKIWSTTLPVSPGQTYSVQIGAGGAPAAAYSAETAGSEGRETTFGAYSSANGAVYPNGYTDVLNGDSYGRTGVSAPLKGSSDGGAGGAGGAGGQGHYVWVRWGQLEGQGYWDFRLDRPSGTGSYGARGGSGFCLIQYTRTDGAESEG